MTRQTHNDTLLSCLEEIYDHQVAEKAYQNLQLRIQRFRNTTQGRLPSNVQALNQADALLITYPDQVTEPGEKPLETLSHFASQHLEGIITSLHILPFFPSTSDDGFAISDYTQVDPGLGSWIDIQQLSLHFRLMFDAVINHTSSQHAWFRGFLSGDTQYQDYYITIGSDLDLSSVVRPRALPLLTTFYTKNGDRQVWSTFSPDQLDLNYQNPNVLVDIAEVVLFYVANGAQLIRLDAIAYLWKEPGTTCLHLPQTHAVIRFIRALLDLVAPYVLLVTETNVPHQENLSYFGNGHNEAQLVYNFSLPPLVLHTLLTGQASALSRWAASLQLPSTEVTFLNFLASHDGIGVNPARGLLTDQEIDRLVAATMQRGGLVGRKTIPGGESVYELNINYFDALNDPQTSEPLELQVCRFMAAQAILLAMPGLPAVYFHSLFGSRGWPEGVRITGHNRTINRQKFSRSELETELETPGSLRWQVYQRFSTLLRARAASAAFDPYGKFQVLDTREAVFGLRRISREESAAVICLQNVTNLPQTVSLDTGKKVLLDLVSGEEARIKEDGELSFQPYQTRWLVGQI